MLTIAQGLLPFQLIEDNSKIMMTSFAGVPLVMEAFRTLGLRTSIQKHLPFLHAQANTKRPIILNRNEKGARAEIALHPPKNISRNVLCG
jgi:hypothetical protein